MVRKAVLKSWNAGTYTADVQVLGSDKAYLVGVTVARSIESAQMVVGRNVVLQVFPGQDPREAVVIAIYT